MTEGKPMTEQDLRVLYDLSIYNCQRFGTFTQLIYEDGGQVREYTNVEAAREATQLAAGLRALGIEKGDRVLVMMVNSPEVVIAYQAIARAGAVIIPVLPMLKAPEVYYIAENSGAKAIFTNSLLLPLLQPALANVATMHYMIVVAPQQTIIRDMAKSDAQAAQHLLQAQEPVEQQVGSPQVISYKTVLAKGGDAAEQYLTDLEGVSLSPDDTAVILYTSGTTGRPKGVVLSHRNQVANALSGNRVDQEQRFSQTHLAILPLAHAYGILMTNIAYLSGTRLLMLPRFDTNAVLSAIERYRIVATAAVPAMIVALLYTPDAEKYDTSSLQYIVSGSAPLPVPVLKAFEQKFHCQIREGYGLSESSAALTGHGADMEQKAGSVGKPLPEIEVQVVDANDHPLPVGEIGEVIARGPNIMQGYYNLPEETHAALRNGWLHTGDMGRFDEDGYLYIVERKKDLIIRGGLNIYPRDIEELLAKHPAVIEAAVVGVPSERMGEEVKAYVVTGTPVDAETLMAYCREHLANYKTPSQIEFIDALPRNIIGKVDKKQLRSLN